MQSKNTVFFALLLLGAGLLIGLGVGLRLSGASARVPAAALTAPQDAGQEAMAVKNAQALRQLTVKLTTIERSLTALTDTPRHAPPPVARADGLCAAVLPDEAVLRQEITRVLREELREVLATVGTGKDRTRAPEGDPQAVLNTEENRQAHDTASDVVLGAVSVGRWTDEDVQDLRSALAYLTSAQREEILQMLIPAINRGEIVVETTGPLF